MEHLKMVQEPESSEIVEMSPIVVIVEDQHIIDRTSRANDTTVKDEKFDIGPFTNKQAQEKLLQTIKSVLKDTEIKLPAMFTRYVVKVHIMIGTIVVSVLILGFILTLRAQLLVESLLILIIIIVNGYVYERTSRRQTTDTWKKIHDFVDKLERFGIGEHELLFSSNLPTVAISRVIRDGEVKQYPCNLLVKGDIVILGLGEMVPAKVRLDNNQVELILERDTRIKPSHLPAIVNPLNLKDLDEKAVFRFQVMETPVESICKASLRSQRPPTFVSHYVKILEQLSNKSSLIFLLIIAIVNIIKYFLIQGPTDLYYLFGYQLVLVVVPLMPIGIPMLLLLTRSYSNAYILTLFDGLQTSKTEFVDADDVDEFDEAPAPTKELRLSKHAIWTTFVDQLLSDGTRTSRARGLIEALAHTTVFCAIDREGTITSPIPSIDEILLFKPNGDAAVLDLSIEPVTKAVRFEDEDWSTYIKTLKPLGLLHILCTECLHRLQGKKELHFKSERFPAGINTSASRQACQCGLGNLIGFQPDILQRFKVENIINTWTKSHPSLIGMEDYHYQIPSIHSTIISEPGQDASVQIFSEGSLDLIFESCTDYW